MNLTADERRFAVQQAQEAVPKLLRPRKDSTEAQLITLLEIASRVGCYDAQTWIKAKMETRYK